MKKEKQTAPIRRLKNRTRYLLEFWQELLAEEPLPQCDRWLARKLKQFPKFGRQDRFWYSEMIFAGLRFGYLAAFLEWWFHQNPPGKITRENISAALQQFHDQYGCFPELRRLWLSISRETFLFWIVLRYREVPEVSPPDHELPDVLMDDPERRNFFELLKPMLANTTELSLKLLWQGIPLWYQTHLQQRIQKSRWSAEEIDRFLERQSYRPPLWLRIADFAKREQILQELLANDFTILEEDLPALAVKGARGIYELDCYRKGWVEIQDWASQQLGALVQARPHQRVWDACAGGGGKTLQIAASEQALRRTGAIYASDIRDYKLKDLLIRARRSGLPNIRTVIWQGEALPRFGKEIDNQGGFHWVLVDAPCTASGTWRRNPDARFRFPPEELPSLTELQLKLLTNASRALRPGGYLVYGTCSWLVAENEDIVERFLRQQGNFQLLEMHLFGNPHKDSDTTFGAVFQRKKE